jgi:hypothetical protein
MHESGNKTGFGIMKAVSEFKIMRYLILLLVSITTTSYLQMGVELRIELLCASNIPQATGNFLCNWCNANPVIYRICKITN